MHKLRDILFLDIETISGCSDFEKLNDRLKSQWVKKSTFINRSEELTPEELYFQKAAIYAEFGKIITIGLGYFHFNKDIIEFRTKAVSGHNEIEVLNEFKDIVISLDPESLQLCAHNGREFDFPYISRRMLINGIKLPSVLNLSGKKPWEINHLDTMDMWKFGDWKHYSSLELLASVFDIESSKTGMDGSEVNKAYYHEDRLKDIAEYCIQDVIVCAQLFLKLNTIDLNLGDIRFVDNTVFS